MGVEAIVLVMAMGDTDGHARSACHHQHPAAEGREMAMDDVVGTLGTEDPT
jgi:hypothetical protein